MSARHDRVADRRASIARAATRSAAPALEEDYAHLGRQLARRGVDIEALIARAMAFRVAVPSWGVGTGGTRFARFPVPGEPRNVLREARRLRGVVQRWSRVTPGDLAAHSRGTSPTTSGGAARRSPQARGLFFDSMNSNTFQDQPGQPLSYKFGSLSHTDAAVRRQAIEHNLECLAIGAAARRARRTPSGSATAATSPASCTSAARSIATSTACERSTRRCPTAGGCSSSTSSTSRRSTRRC